MLSSLARTEKTMEIHVPGRFPLFLAYGKMYNLGGGRAKNNKTPAIGDEEKSRKREKKMEKKNSLHRKRGKKFSIAALLCCEAQKLKQKSGREI